MHSKWDDSKMLEKHLLPLTIKLVNLKLGKRMNEKTN